MLAAIPAWGESEFRDENPRGTVSSGHACAPCPAKLFLVTWRAEPPEIISFPAEISEK